MRTFTLSTVYVKRLNSVNRKFAYFHLSLVRPRLDEMYVHDHIIYDGLPLHHMRIGFFDLEWGVSHEWLTPTFPLAKNIKTVE